MQEVLGVSAPWRNQSTKPAGTIGSRSGGRCTTPSFVAQPDCWAGQADRFAAAAQRGVQPDGFMRLLLPRLRSTDRVIDIGAGTGRYEPLLAAHAADVLAIEPSPSMRDQLERRLAEAPATNVRVGAASWPPG